MKETRRKIGLLAAFGLLNFPIFAGVPSEKFLVPYPVASEIVGSIPKLVNYRFDLLTESLSILRRYSDVIATVRNTAKKLKQLYIRRKRRTPSLETLFAQYRRELAEKKFYGIEGEKILRFVVQSRKLTKAIASSTSQIYSLVRAILTQLGGDSTSAARREISKLTSLLQELSLIEGAFTTEISLPISEGRSDEALKRMHSNLMSKLNLLSEVVAQVQSIFEKMPMRRRTAIVMDMRMIDASYSVLERFMAPAITNEILQAMQKIREGEGRSISRLLLKPGRPTAEEFERATERINGALAFFGDLSEAATFAYLVAVPITIFIFGMALTDLQDGGGLKKNTVAKIIRKNFGKNSRVTVARLVVRASKFLAKIATEATRSAIASGRITDELEWHLIPAYFNELSELSEKLAEEWSE